MGGAGGAGPWLDMKGTEFGDLWLGQVRFCFQHLSSGLAENLPCDKIPAKTQGHSLRFISDEIFLLHFLSRPISSLPVSAAYMTCVNAQPPAHMFTLHHHPTPHLPSLTPCLLLLLCTLLIANASPVVVTCMNSFDPRIFQVAANKGVAPETAPMKDLLASDENNRWRLEAQE